MSNMPPKDRRDAILYFLYHHGFPLPPMALFRAMKITQNITFSYRTVQNACSEMYDEGLMMRCDKDAMDNGTIKPIEPDSDAQRTYYYPTEAAMGRIEEYEESLN